ncbi:hypothetical protein [Aureivirga sp. CE67]|uniref:hypothetical protein n=1 Tax=Aureivirga sp. CE67 TaxID=1788983 RepID=UPI0018C91C36|nr:hypothetical protein [Aureivirga sp. CE67]
MKKTYLILCAFFLSLSIYAQSAWTQKKNEWYVQAGFSNINEYSRLFGTNDNTYRTSRKITDNTLQIYAKYGITDKTTVLIDLPYKILKTGDIVDNPTHPLTIKEGDFSGLGNITVGVQQKLIDKGVVVSGQLNIGINTSDFDNETGLRTGYDAWEIIPTINIGKGWEKVYLQGNFGFNFKTNKYSNSVVANLEGGIKFINRIWVIGGIHVLESFEDGEIALPMSNLQTGLYLDNQEFIAYGFKILGEITPKFGAVIGTNSAFSGNLVARKNALSFGIYTKF